MQRLSQKIKDELDLIVNANGRSPPEQILEGSPEPRLITAITSGQSEIIHDVLPGFSG
jgi:hypothetical protein